MNQQKSKADLLMEKLEEAFIKEGLKPPKRVEKKGCFVTIYLNDTNRGRSKHGRTILRT